MSSDAGQDSRRASDIALDYVSPSLYNSSRHLSALLRISDALAVFLTGCACAFLYNAAALNNADAPAVLLPEHSVSFLTVALLASLLGGLLPLLIFRQGPVRQHSSNIAVVLGLAALDVMVLVGLLLAIGFLTNTLVLMPRPWVVAWGGMAFVAVAGSRVLLLFTSTGAPGRLLLRKQVAVVGDPSAADLLLSGARNTWSRRMEVVGVYQDGADLSQPGTSGRDLACLIELAKLHPLDTVLLAIPRDDEERLARAVTQLKALNVDIVLWAAPDGPEGAHAQDSAHHTAQHSAHAPHSGRDSAPARGQAHMVTLVSRPIGLWGLALKALEDKVIATALIVSLLPLMAIIAIAIKANSPGPVLFRQQRYGLNNTKFYVFKFRSMTWGGSGAATGRQQTQRNDPRTTSVGRFLRRSSLDELPQLLNVLRGEMSLVGPRPHPTVMLTGDRLSEEIVPDYAHRHRVKPGLTGWAQINGFRGATSTPEQVKRRVEYDLVYIDNWSIFLDLKILALTPIRMILDSEGAF